MHLEFERNIQIPGTFVVCQGIPGDGLLNTIDSEPDFGAVQIDSGPSSEATSRESQTEPQNNPPPTRTFLGQGILPPTRTIVSSQVRSPHGSLQPSISDRRNLHRENNQSLDEQSSSSNERYEILPSPPSVLSSSEDEGMDSPSTSIQDQVQLAVDSWMSEKAATHKQQADDWIRMVMEQQRFHPTNLNSSIPILSKCSHRWWIDPDTAMLRVFRKLPSPLPQDEQHCYSVHPGTTVVATAIYTFQLVQTNLPLHAPIAWRNFGSYKDCSLMAEPLPLAHHPKVGRIQYLQIEEPFQGYVLFSVDGYNVAVPGFPSSPIFTGVTESSSLDQHKPMMPCWYWKVVGHMGAVVRRGVDLSSRPIGRLPYGTNLQVVKKVINAAGLSRLFVRAQTVESGRIEGWCSEMLNPLSGQRGPILQPIPLAVPAIYRIRQPCVVRKTVELSGPIIRELEHGINATVPVLSRVYSEFPTQNCLVRLRLAPMAFASLRLNTRNSATGLEPSEGGEGIERIILQPTAKIDGSFDPSDPGMYHWRLRQQWIPYLAPASPAESQESSESNDNSIDELSSFDGSSSWSPVDAPVSEVTKEPAQNHHQEQLCMCCEDNKVNATIVHGETGHICVCLECARVCKAQGLGCPICRLPIDSVILHYYA